MKKFIDKDTHNYILEVLNENGINDEIIKLASHMDIDLVHIFYDKIIGVKDLNKLNINKDIIVKMFLGIYGNFIASSYYKALGFDVKNEDPICDEEGNEITRADISFVDSFGNLHLCEVKTTPQIIDNIRNYQQEDEQMYNDKYYYDMDNDIIKYKEIGKKLINQSKKLKTASNNVNVVIFSGCFMDDIIKDKLTNLGVNVKVIGIDVNELKRNVEYIVENISNKLNEPKKNIYFYGLKNAS